jgi:hypothetical protein
MCVGLVLALSATFVSTFINHWVLAGIPLQHPPQLSQIPFGILAGVVVGYLAARPDSTVLGIVVSAAVVTVFLGLRTVVAQSFAATQILGQLLLLLPSFALTCLLTLALRVFTKLVHQQLLSPPRQPTHGSAWYLGWATAARRVARQFWSLERRRGASSAKG